MRPDSGVIRIDGRPAAISSPLDAQRAGIGMIYQELDLFPDLSIGENLVIGNLHFAERWFVAFPPHRSVLPAVPGAGGTRSAGEHAGLVALASARCNWWRSRAR